MTFYDAILRTAASLRASTHRTDAHTENVAGA